MERSPPNKDIQLNEDQQEKYDRIFPACPDAAKRENYEIIWIDKNPNSPENTIYIKIFDVKGYKPL
jgi:hypothetical protein